MEPEQSLVCRIFEQAITDYKTLKENGASSLKEDDFRYSRKEIEKFLTSEFGARLLSFVNTDLDGSEILSKLTA